MRKKHKIKNVQPDSIGEELEIEPGDFLLSINNRPIKDILDYNYLIHDEKLVVVIEKPNNEEWELEIIKDYEDDLGIVFEDDFMDTYQSCRNQCIFCFIDQMPPGMRDTLYFKDDDARLSFLQGNYVTLTNLTVEDIERILFYKLSPINISVHTTNKELRCQMLKNRFAGDALDKIKILFQGGIEMNSQIVLCKGYNDGMELEKTIEDLSKMLPHMRSLSVVPVGITKYREGLVSLEKFQKEDSALVIEIIQKWQKILLKKYETRFVFASDEWYLKAEMPIPEEEEYEGYGQLENGVGMVRCLVTETQEYLNTLKGDSIQRTFSIATGVLAAPILKNLLKSLKVIFPNLKGTVYTIQNDFFGRDITVAGLLTGQDIIRQLKGKSLGNFLILPSSLLRSNEQVLLDDYTINDLERALQIEIRIVQSDGVSLVDAIIK